MRSKLTEVQKIPETFKFHTHCSVYIRQDELICYFIVSLSLLYRNVLLYEITVVN